MDSLQTSRMTSLSHLNYQNWNVPPPPHHDEVSCHHHSCDTSEQPQLSFFGNIQDIDRTLPRSPAVAKMQRATLNLTCPVIPLIIAAFLHFTLSALALLGVNISAAFFFTHLVVVLVGIWSSRDKTSLEPVLAFIFVLIFSCLIDIIMLGVYWDEMTASDIGKFSASMVIINLLLKPVSVMFSVFVLYQRNGSFNFLDYFRAQSAYNEIGGHVDVEGGSSGGHNNE